MLCSVVLDMRRARLRAASRPVGPGLPASSVPTCAHTALAYRHQLQDMCGRDFRWGREKKKKHACSTGAACSVEGDACPRFLVFALLPASTHDQDKRIDLQNDA